MNLQPDPVNDIDRWFDQTASGKKRVVSLYPSLLTGRIFAYLRYRLRYSLLVTTTQFAVHVAEYFLILSTLGGMAAFTVMILRAGSLIVGGAWWGLLEVMRERLRRYARSGERDAAEQEIGRWLVLSVLLAIIVTAGAGVALVLFRPSGDDPVARLYAFLVVLELAINIPVRVLHSGIFATRRVYRPVWAMFVQPTVQLAVLGIGFYYYPTVAIIIAITMSNAIGIWITVHYSLEAYRMVGLQPRLPTPTSAFWRLLPSIPPWLGFKTTCSGLSLRLDGVLVLAIVGIYGTNTRSFDLTAGVSAWRHVDTFQFFYLILPVFRGSYEGAGIFYFDFVRLRSSSALYEFRLFFFHRLLGVAPLFGLYFWALAAALAAFVMQGVPMSFLLALIPLFVVRSLIGIYQIRLFAEGRSGTHLATFMFLGVLLWLVWIKPDPASDLIQITAAMIVQLIVLMDVQHFRDRKPPPLPALLTLGDWLPALAREPGPVVVGNIVMPQSVTSKQRSATVTLMDRTFEGTGYWTFRSATGLLYFQRAGDTDGAQPPHVSLQTVTGGVVNRGRSSRRPAANGRDALERLIAEPWVQPITDGSIGLGGVETLAGKFRSHFPEGIVVDLRNFEGARDMRSLDQNILARALPAAMKSLADGAFVVPLSSHWLSPVYDEGTLRLLLVTPPDADATLVKGWLQCVKAWNVSRGGAEAAGHARIG